MLELHLLAREGETTKRKSFFFEKKKQLACLMPCQWIVEGLPSRLTNWTMMRSPALA